MATVNNADVQFILERSSESWHYLAWLLAAIIVVIFVLRRYGPKPPGMWKWISLSCRSIGLILVILMLAGPAWETTEHHTQPGQISVAIDLSQSMARADAAGDKTRVSLAGDFYRALEQREQAPNNTYNYKSICANGTAISVDDLRNNQLQASGSQSRLANEIIQIANSSQQDALVLISDGRSTDQQQLEAAARHLRDRDIALYILACGSSAVKPELNIAEVIGNRDIARGERQPFTLSIDSRGLIGEDIKINVTNGSGEVLNQSTYTIGNIGDGNEKDLSAQLINSESSIDVILHSEGDETLHFNLEGPNGLRSSISIQVHVSERKLRVLMLAHHPRYEMRYLRNALDRDATVEIHSYLADGRWRRWGADRFGPGNLPLQSSELKEYDAVIIGDINATALHLPAQENLVRAVRQYGLGLIWLPGERGAIAEFRNSTLGKLIPATLPDASSIQQGYLKGMLHQANVTELGRQYLKSGKIEWADLPDLIGNCPIDEKLKKGSQVLMHGTDDIPLIISRQYGSGRATLIAIDDTWRWRKNVGDFYLHRFHSSLLRFTSSGRQLHRKPWQILNTPSRARLGEAVQITVAPTGPLGEEVNLADSITLRLDHGDEHNIVRLHRDISGQSYGLSTSFFTAGTYTMSIADGLLSDEVRNSELTILNATAENADPRIDNDALTNLAEATGGKIFSDPVELAQAIPDRQRRRSERRVEAVWDSMWLLIIAISVFCVEWAIRRHFRLP